jgi:hypothetical protein
MISASHQSINSLNSVANAPDNYQSRAIFTNFTERQVSDPDFDLGRKHSFFHTIPHRFLSLWFVNMAITIA